MQVLEDEVFKAGIYTTGFVTKQLVKKIRSNNIKGEKMMTKVYASMAGNVWKIVVGVGDTVEEEQDVVILESMKMEIPIISEEAGTVMKINVQEGDFCK